jgi:hypothetical protein
MMLGSGNDEDQKWCEQELEETNQRLSRIQIWPLVEVKGTKGCKVEKCGSVRLLNILWW